MTRTTKADEELFKEEFDNIYNLISQIIQPIGSYVALAYSNTVSDGYLLCDGSEYLVADYADLDNVLNNTYGEASDSDHF